MTGLVQQTSIDPVRKYVGQDFLNPSLSQKERVRSAAREMNHFSGRINKTLKAAVLQSPSVPGRGTPSLAAPVRLFRGGRRVTAKKPRGSRRRMSGCGAPTSTAGIMRPCARPVPVRPDAVSAPPSSGSAAGRPDAPCAPPAVLPVSQLVR